MIRSLALIPPILALLAGCALSPQTAREPERISLGSDRLEVRLRDGTFCRATVPLTGHGEGDFADCPGQSWTIDIRHRNWLEPIFGHAVAPYAHLVISDGSGHSWAYDTPPLLGNPY